MEKELSKLQIKIHNLSNGLHKLRGMRSVIKDIRKGQSIDKISKNVEKFIESDTIALNKLLSERARLYELMEDDNG